MKLKNGAKITFYSIFRKSVREVFLYFLGVVMSLKILIWILGSLLQFL